MKHIFSSEGILDQLRRQFIRTYHYSISNTGFRFYWCMVHCQQQTQKPTSNTELKMVKRRHT